MNSFVAFLKINKLKQKDIAEFLGITPQFMSQICKGLRPLPDEKFALLKANKRGWDISMFSGGHLSQNVSGNENQFTGIGDLHTGIPVAVHQQVLTRLDQSMHQLDQSMQQNSRLIAIIENMQKINKK